MVRVHSIDQVQVGLLKTKPPQVGLAVDGQVPTSGWHRSRLGPWFYVRPPDDGIQDFDFIAEPPEDGTIVLPFFRPISAEAIIPVDPSDYWGPGNPLKGVRVHGQTNSREALLSATDSALDVPFLTTRGDDPIPWPWRQYALHHLESVAGSDQPLSEMLGKTVRLYRRGDVLTDDFRRDRANVELDPNTERVVRVWFG